MQEHEKINYVEFPASDLEATKSFFTKAFGWEFTNYGPEYCDFANQGIHGGFYKSEKKATTETGSALIIFYSNDLESTLEKVETAGGKIIKPTFAFPGGRRFHFTEPSGNEFAVWSDKGTE
jgi:predicted enzyme related to lactoylglutathione lyase